MDINIFERDYPNLNNTTPSKDINHLMQQKRRTLLTLHFLKSTLPRILYIYIYIYIVCNHEITQAMQFAETSFQHSWINKNLQNFIELLTVTSGL